MYDTDKIHLKFNLINGNFMNNVQGSLRKYLTIKATFFYIFIDIDKNPEIQTKTRYNYFYYII